MGPRAAGPGAARGRCRRYGHALSRVLPEAHRPRRFGVSVKFVATLHVRPRRDVRDPQGDAVARALRSIGLAVDGVRVGKEIVVRFEATDEDDARQLTQTM